MDTSETRMTAAEFDARLRVATEQKRLSVLAQEERNRELERLVSQKETLAARLEAVWQDAVAERERIDHEIDRLLALSPR